MINDLTDSRKRSSSAKAGPITLSMGPKDMATSQKWEGGSWLT